MAKEKIKPVKIGVISGFPKDKRFQFIHSEIIYDKNGWDFRHDYDVMNMDYCCSCDDYTVSEYRFSGKKNEPRSFVLDDVESEEQKVCSHCGKELQITKDDVEKCFSNDGLDRTGKFYLTLMPSKVSVYMQKNEADSISAMKCRQTGYAVVWKPVHSKKGAFLREPFVCDYIFDFDKQRNCRVFDRYLEQDNHTLELVYHSFCSVPDAWAKSNSVGGFLNNGSYISGNFMMLKDSTKPSYMDDLPLFDTLGLRFLSPLSNDVGDRISTPYVGFPYPAWVSNRNMERIEGQCMDLVYRTIAEDLGLPKEISLDRLEAEDGLFSGTLGTCTVPWEKVDDAKMATLWFVSQFHGVSDWLLDKVNTELHYTAKRMAAEGKPMSEERKQYIRLAELTSNMCIMSYMDFKLLGDLRKQRTKESVDKYLHNIVFGFQESNSLHHQTAIDTEDAMRDAYYGKKLKGRFNQNPLVTAHNVYTLQKAGVNTLDYVNLAFQRLEELRTAPNDVLKSNPYFSEGMLHRISTKEEMALIRTMSANLSHKQVVEAMTEKDTMDFSTAASLFDRKKASIAKNKDDILYNRIAPVVLQVLSNTMRFSKKVVDRSEGSVMTIQSEQKAPLNESFYDAWGSQTDSIFQDIVSLAKLYGCLDKQDLLANPVKRLPLRYTLSDDGNFLFKGSFSEINSTLKSVVSVSGELDLLAASGFPWSQEVRDRYEYVTKDGQYSFRLARNKNELEQVSSLLSNCVRSYDSRCTEGSSNIVLMRDNQERYIACIEVDRNGGLVQFKTYYNGHLEGASEVAAALEWLDETKIDYDRCRDVQSFDANGPFPYTPSLDRLGRLTDTSSNFPSVSEMKSGLSVVRSRLEKLIKPELLAEWKTCLNLNPNDCFTVFSNGKMTVRPGVQVLAHPEPEAEVDLEWQ